MDVSQLHPLLNLPLQRIHLHLDCVLLQNIQCKQQQPKSKFHEGMVFAIPIARDCLQRELCVGERRRDFPTSNQNLMPSESSMNVVRDRRWSQVTKYELFGHLFLDQLTPTMDP
mmetsp:Transcript_17474/g.36409  ORF Transcript_17474/g.36409 Transcript_17474/m.36409 type:complete len:114 (+) Transcript_17474:794-1135(+)